MQLYIEREVIRRRCAPAFKHSRFGHGIKSGVHLDRFEMLRIPLKPLAGGHFFWIPPLDKPGIRPARRANEDFSCWVFAPRVSRHASTKSQPVAHATRLAFLTGVPTKNFLFRFALNRH